MATCEQCSENKLDVSYRYNLNETLCSLCDVSAREHGKKHIPEVYCQVEGCLEFAEYVALYGHTPLCTMHAGELAHSNPTLKFDRIKDE